MPAISAAAGALSFVILTTTLAVATAVVDAQDACSGTRLHCLFTPDAAAAVNCSAEAVAAAAIALSDDDDHDDEGNSQVATFVQRAPAYQPSLLQLQLPPSASSHLESFDVVNLSELVRCFGLTYQVSLVLVSGNAQCRLRPGSLAAFGRAQRLTLRLRFFQDRIPAGLFEASLARLENLQLDSPSVSGIDSGAFEHLSQLSRLSIGNLKVAYLPSDVLRGLGKLRFLELPGNSLTRLDAASFAGSPRLESIDLRTVSGPSSVDLAGDTFCSLTVLELLQYSKGLEALNCSHFASRLLHLSLSLGGGATQSISCERLLGQATACSGGSPAGVHVRTTTATTTTAKQPSTSTATTTSTTTTVTSTSTASKKPPQMTTARTASRRPSITPATSSSTSSSPQPGQAAVTPNKQATGAGGGGGSSAGGAAAAVVVVVALLIVAAAVGIFLVRRRRTGVLRRATSRQPIFSGGGSGSLDLQESVWNPAFGGGDGCLEMEAPDAAATVAASQSQPTYEE